MTWIEKIKKKFVDWKIRRKGDYIAKHSKEFWEIHFVTADDGLYNKLTFTSEAECDEWWKKMCTMHLYYLTIRHYYENESCIIEKKEIIF